MRVLLIVVAICSIPSAWIGARILREVFRSPGREVRGEAHRPSGSEPRGGGDPVSHAGADQVSDNPCPSVPAHEQLRNYRPARENRHWVNDHALAVVLDRWSSEAPS